ncbi:MAG: PAS domain S-box protein [Algicola sp.]|nr:PAS domain S-box protein [Algicola sp.]
MPTLTNSECYNIHDTDLLKTLKNHSIISVFDTNGRILYSNDNFSKILGVSKKDIEVPASQLMRSLIHSRELFWKIWSVIQAGKEWNGILFHEGKNDKNYWLETTITPIKDSNGEVIKYITNSKDITNFYSEENDYDSTHNHEKRLIGDITKEELFITRNGKIFNTSQTELNHTDNSVLGLFVYDFVNPLHVDCFKKRIDKVFLEGKTSSYQSVGLTSKGNQAFYITKIKPVFNLQNEVIYAILKSKKQRNSVKVNKQLKAVETKYSNIFQSINVGIIVVANSKGKIIEWNEGAERAFGYADSEIIGEHLSILISKKEIKRGVKELLKEKNKLDNNLYGGNIEMLGLKKNGEEFPVEFTMSHWNNGKEKFYCAIMLDISKRKKLEEKLIKTTKDLELFLYRSAHDLKAPLTSAEGLLLLLKEEKLNDKVSVLVNMLIETLEKGRYLLDDMAFASIICEKKRDIAPVDFQNTIKNTLAVSNRIEKFNDMTFNLDIQQTTDFYFNKELLDSIFQNLIQNAIYFSIPKTRTKTPTVNVSVKSTDKDVSIVVSDNGLGIKEDHIDKVFDLYFRVCNVNHNGTGLGLYVVKRIVEDFNGNITLRSEINKGTSFEVILPNLIEQIQKND